MRIIWRRLKNGVGFLALLGYGLANVQADSERPLLPSAADLEPFYSQLELAAQANDFVGLAVAIVGPDGQGAIKTYGVTDVTGTEPVTEDTVFRIASLSKGFAASLASLSVSEGQLSLDAPVTSWVPQFSLVDNAQRSRVTIGHLLSHRVGLPPNAYDNLLEADIDPLEILARYAGVELVCPVGDCYAYQNVSYNMIASVLEQVSAEDYATLMKKRIFEPLGMRHASLGRDALLASDKWARPHVRRTRTQWVPVNVKQAYYNLPAASGINASIRDMAVWLSAQLGNKPEVLPSDVLARIHTPAVQSRAETRRWRRLGNRVKDTHYGLGWRIYDYAGNTLITHSGSVEGYMAQIAMLPEEGLGIVILANTRARRAWRIMPTFLDVSLNLKPEDWLELRDLGP